MVQAHATGHEPGTPPSGFESLDPRTGELVGTHPVMDAEQVTDAVRRAETAASWWRELGFGGRRQRLLAWRSLLVRRMDKLAELIAAETGKPTEDAKLEIVLTVDHVDWAARNAEKALGRRRVRAGWLMTNQAATVAYPPYGVVGVIGPWNYPMFTPMGSIGYALAAGNAVVFKPSELTPGVGVALAETFAEVVPEHPVLQVVTGFGETGAALCRAGVGKLAFTGSTGTAKKVMAACAETLTPVLIECGGKDALIVDADADLDAAADAAVWGGMQNAGQTCVGVERVYVLEPVAQELTSRVIAKAKALRPGSDSEADFGPMTLDRQTEVVREHVADAVARGANVVVGGMESIRPPFVGPIVLTEVPEDAPAVTEETFGPVLVINSVPDVEEAVRRANDSDYGLAAAVFSASRGEELAAQLRCGMVSVNSVLSFAAVPSLPFGGVGGSGFGRIHGADGLREFARPHAVTRRRWRPPLAILTFDRTRRATWALLRAARLLYGRRR